MNSKEFALNLIDFINSSPSSYQAIANMCGDLDKEGYKRLDSKKPWQLEKGCGYYYTENDSALIAFKLPEKINDPYFHIIGSHSDSPCFRLKPKAILSENNGYIKVTSEVYGGPILSTWLDRPLSIAGRVFLRGENYTIKSKLVNIDKDLLIIPNLAIHQNREINKGYEYNPQIDMQAIMGLKEEGLEGDITKKIIASEIGEKEEDILEYDLYFYPRENGCLIGLNEEFISAPRLDNLAMAHASLKALLDSKNSKAIKMVVVTDNEEVGSSSRQGADSPIIKFSLERILIALGFKDNFHDSLARSFLISSDMAHAIHPNRPEKSDPNNHPLLGKGPVIKYAANKAYTSDGQSASYFRCLADEVSVPIQVFTNRSDTRGGSTIGPISQSQLGINSVDIGNTSLSMHSIRELAHVDDHMNIYLVFKNYFSK